MGVGVVVVVVVVVVISRNQVRGHRTDFSHSGPEEYPREKHKQIKGDTCT